MIKISKKVDNSEAIKEVQDRFRFILLIAIFFYTILSNGSNENKAELSIYYGGLVGMYFLAFFLFEILKNRFNNFWLKVINILTLVGIGIFITPIFLMVFVAKISPQIFSAILKIPIFGMMILPISLTAIISWTSEFKK
jgi:hypothetical protein